MVYVGGSSDWCFFHWELPGNAPHHSHHNNLQSESHMPNKKLHHKHQSATVATAIST
jgi:hypothetical protein